MEEEELQKLDKEVLIKFILTEVFWTPMLIVNLHHINKWHRVEKLQKEEDAIAEKQKECDCLSENADYKKWKRLETKRVKLQEERWALTA